MLKRNKIYCGDCVDVMQQIDAAAIDLTVTSPPYDNLRDYEGYIFNFEGIAKELFRITKEGGVVVWIIGDATIDGDESGTSFKQALRFKEIGFKLHDTMIYRNPGTGAKGSNYCYWQAFEYMFVFVKGKIKTVNRLKDKKNKCYGTRSTSGRKSKETKTRLHPREGTLIQKYGIRENIWTISAGHGHGDETKHPAPFPEQLAKDHIISWCNERDLVLDPMAGSGTTCKMAKLNNRDYIGIDISPKYCEIARKRLNKIPVRLDTFFDG